MSRNLDCLLAIPHYPTRDIGQQEVGRDAGPMRTVAVSLVLLLLVTPDSFGAVSALFSAEWREDFASVKQWHAESSWLSNPSPGATVTTDGDAACFTVPVKGQGMKWRRPLRSVWIGQNHCLVVRYRAEGLRTDSDDYFVYIDDGGEAETRPIRLEDIVADGQWQTVGVDLDGVAESDTLKAVALQVQAEGDEGGRVWLGDLRFCDRLPDGVVELTRGERREPKAPWWADLEKAEWEAQPAWLTNDATEHGVKRSDGRTVFRVDEPARGMKWSWFFGEEVELAGHRYVAMRYRATGTAARSDYALCVLATANPDGRSYTAIIGPGDLRHDGRWHTVAMPLSEAAAMFPTIKGLAIQAQAAAAAGGRLEVAAIGFVEQTEPTPARDFLACGLAGDTTGFTPMPLGPGNVTVEAVMEAMRVAPTDWPYGERIAVDGVPFLMPAAGAQVWATGLAQKNELTLDAAVECSQIFLLVAAMPRGREEDVYVRDGLVSEIREIDRFRLRLEYADGTSEVCFPYSCSLREFVVTDGASVLCAFADPGRRLQRVILCDNTDRAAFAVLALTARTAGERLFVHAAEEWPPVRPRPAREVADRPTSAERRGDVLVLDTAAFHAEIGLTPLPRVVALTNHLGEDSLFAEPSARPLYAVSVQGTPVAPERFELRECRVGPGGAARLEYTTGSPPDVRLTVRLASAGPAELAFDVSVGNVGRQTVRIGLAGPDLGPFVLGDDLRSNHYVFPKSGWHYHDRPCSLRARYGGRFPVQFMATIEPGAGSGLYVRTEDLEGIMRDYLLEKRADGMRLALEYPDRAVEPGGRLQAVRTILGVSDGDWHTAYDAYVKWKRTWYKPLTPRKRWFREVFNFRQRFLWSHDPLCDRATGTFRLDSAFNEMEQHFGGVEYFHLFDWGYCGKYGRIYGRTGDHSPYDYIKGGRPALKKGIEAIQARGVPVGLYIEGYLLQERGRLGQAHGKDWQLVSRGGQGVYWPDSTEMMTCPWVSAWREVQAGTYATKVEELDVDGMYLDQFGFANTGKDCWTSDHGHPVPGYAVLGERGLSTLVRRRIEGVKEGVALYSEEAPCDVSSQVQDGSFSYHMRACRASQPWAPVHLFRFAVPSFKTFEILVCDRPTGSWAEGVKWVFFNGEGIWIEGPAQEWFWPQTLAAIRKGHGILRAHRDAFASDDPVPLVATEMAGVHANLFPSAAGRKAVYTLYNARHRSVNGPVLAIPTRPDARYRDLWNGAGLTPTRRNGRDVLSVTLEPRDVGCVLCTW